MTDIENIIREKRNEMFGKWLETNDPNIEYCVDMLTEIVETLSSKEEEYEE